MSSNIVFALNSKVVQNLAAAVWTVHSAIKSLIYCETDGQQTNGVPTEALIYGHLASFENAQKDRGKCVKYNKAQNVAFHSSVKSHPKTIPIDKTRAHLDI